MARVANVNIPDDKRVVVSLTYIKGIGHSRAAQVLQKTGISPDTRVKDLTETELGKIREAIEADYEVETELAQRQKLNIARLREINCYRGLRHKASLPSRGQRTRTNARTRRGRRSTVGGAKKVMPGK